MHLAKTMALALLTVLLGAAFFRWGYLPQEEEIARIEAQVAQDKEELVRIQNFMNANMGVSDRTKEMKSRLTTAKRRLPEEMDQGGFIALLEREAQHERIVLSAVAPGKAAAEGEALRLPIDVEMEGDYFRFLAFLQALEASERFIRVESTEIRSDEGKLHIKLCLSIFSGKA